jgi:mannitol-1-phosphate 5-dehydrogenase
MGLDGKHTYVGFGFGAIQAGLFLYEAYQSGNFARLVTAEVMPEMIAAVRADGGYFQINIAHADHVEAARIGPIELYNPNLPEERAQLIDAIADAHEIGTAVPSVKAYASDSEASLHRVLAAGILRKAEINGGRAVIYTAENNNQAAEILHGHVVEALGEATAALEHVRFLNTVVGKMSGLAEGNASLAPVTAANSRAWLVEAFNRILITQVDFAEAFQRGISVFEEKHDLYPFEEAKLYGHNATHALGAYLARLNDLHSMDQLRAHPRILALMRDAFLNESGAALLQKYVGVDPLFTPDGYAAYADDLLARMTNPFLCDTVERVGRDPVRKLGWDDRLIGTMRLALQQGTVPKGYALGAAAALHWLDPARPPRALLLETWGDAAPASDEREAVLGLVENAYAELETWRTP